MTNCTACGHELPPDSAFCEECGTPSDATNVHGSGNHPTQPFGATGSPSYAPQGQYGGPSGEAPTTFSGAYGQGGQGGQAGQGDQGAPPPYGGGYAAPQGGYDQGQYGQGGYDQGQYGQGGYDQGGFNQGGYGPGGYDGGEYGAPPGGAGGSGGNGKRKWIIIWSIVALLVVAAIVAVLMLTVFKGDDNGGDDDPGGDDTSSTEGGDSGSGIELGAVNEVEMDGDEAVIEVEAEAGQIIVLSSEQEDLSDPTYDFDDFYVDEGWFEGAGVSGWDAAEDGTQEIRIAYDGDEDLTSIEVYVDVIDAERIQPGDEVELADGAEVGAAIYEDTDGEYAVPSGMFTDFFCSDGDECTLYGEVLAVVTDSGLTIEETDADPSPTDEPTTSGTPGAAVLPDGSTSGGTTMPPGGASTTITATASGVITIELIDVAGGGSGGAIDFRLRVLDGARAELCNRDSSYDDEECAIEVVEGEAYKIEVTEYTGDPAATSDFRLNIVPGGEIF
ncbi:zinc ribbon domain-containing protein [Nocardioides sp. ChNu-153]|uniref:zinc ribbon domain-containing protein n=1 Tax=unclassified Nocardioides TaxID=2615069 RepID=UPI0024061659|nr:MULTISPECIES: zinc ribbon domain-containing protein [unclassified Nocardioides]MDF9715204.1 zinc ribbon domain-containing protein [Nocardioides sp. ChNu-99]MDN7121017.1 zinc ribbon domain-containing protein [Nocardioides sp. ChNu-153]